MWCDWIQWWGVGGFAATAVAQVASLGGVRISASQSLLLKDVCHMSDLHGNQYCRECSCRMQTAALKVQPENSPPVQ